MFRRNVLVLCALASAPFAQGTGDYMNFESPHVKSITSGLVDGKDYVLVCNTPDNSVEVYDPVGDGFVARIPVGFEPVSVTYHEPLQAFFTANFIGDSVTRVDVDATAGNFTYAVQWTRYVGDEPVHVALDTNGVTAIVTKRSKSSFAWLSAGSGYALGGGSYDEVLMTEDGIFPDHSLLTGDMAVKEPHTVLFDPSGSDRIFVLGQQGGGAPENLTTFENDDPGGGSGGMTSPGMTIPPLEFDLDVFVHDLQSGATSIIDDIGTTNFNMAFSSGGDLYIVSTRARNDKKGTATLAALPTGFVTTNLHKVIDPGGPNETKLRRNLNRGPVVPSDSLAHATDIVVYESGGETKVIVAGFNSDRIGVVDTSSSNPNQWTIERCDIIPLTHPVAGPRALAIKYANPGVPNDPGDRVYVVNRLDHSVAVIDPTGPIPVVVNQFPLQNDPVPGVVREGAQFLYSTNFSGNGFVSCSSCHVDGRSDQQQWELTTDTPPGIPLPDFPLEIGGIQLGVYANLILTGEFPVNKGPMITQSLQGLLNFETDLETADFVTNAPYHWRGDKPAFTDFNEAFVNLQGMPDIGPPGDPKGLSDEDMNKYLAFVNTVHYPSNPEQPLTRKYDGDLGDPDDDTDGDGALFGLKLFHTFALDLHDQPGGELNPFNPEGGRSCVQCHFLPEGSNNRITEVVGTAVQPIETAALRGLIQKEGRLELTDDVGEFPNDMPFSGDWGLNHEGTDRSINDFNRIFRPVFLDDAPQLLADQQLDAVNLFTRQFDWGLAPAAGLPLTVTHDTKSGADSALDLMEGQVDDANIGIAVYAVLDDVERGFWFRITGSTRVYQEVAPGNATFTRAALLNELDVEGEVLVFTGTPLGSDQRTAALDGVRAILAGSPLSITNLGTTPNTAYVDVPSLTKNWRKTTVENGFDFFWFSNFITVGDPFPADEPLSLKTARIYQQALGLFPTVVPGVPYSHEAPRRLCFDGTGILEGAKVTLHVHTAPGVPPPPIGSPPVIGTPDEAQYQFVNLTFPIFPRRTGTAVHWETAVELDILELHRLLLGGPAAPGVAAALDGSMSEPPVATDFAPDVWNSYQVTVTNPDGSDFTSDFQRLLYAKP